MKYIHTEMKYKILFLFLLCLPLAVMAENASNARARQRNSDIIITYDLSHKSNVSVYVSFGSDDSFRLLKAVEGAVGENVRPGKNLEIIWHPLDEEESLIAENVRFKVEALDSYELYLLPQSRKGVPQGGKTNMETFLLGNLAYSIAPQMSYGLTIGQTYSGIGWYVSARSNYHFKNATGGLECSEGGFIGGIFPFYSGRTESSIFVANIGVVVDFFEWTKVSMRNRFNTIGVYVGTGYGFRQLLWETSDGRWVKYNPTSCNGICANVGIIGSVYGLTLKAGVNTIAFKYMELEAGIGWMF